MFWLHSVVALNEKGQSDNEFKQAIVNSNVGVFPAIVNEQLKKCNSFVV